jgi:UDP-glucose 4-epimerase
MPDISRILVTGCNGFIGQHFCEFLAEKPLYIRTISRQSLSGVKSHHHFTLDLTSDNYPAELCEGIDTIFHLAGKAHALSENRQDSFEYRNINTEATRKLLETAQQAGVKRFIYFSSVKAVGDSLLQPMDELAIDAADTPYGQSKFEAEQLVLHGGYVPHPVVIRPCMVYGDSDKGNLPQMINAIRRGFFPAIPELNNRRSMVHVDDLVRAAWLATENVKAAGQIYIVSDEQAYSTRQIYDSIRLALGKQPTQAAIPLIILQSLAKIGDVIGRLSGRRFLFDSDRLGKLSDSAWYSSAKIADQLGFKPCHTLPQSLPDIIKYLNSR